MSDTTANIDPTDSVPASRSVHDESFWDHVPAEFLRTLVEQGRDNGLPTSIFSLGDPHRLETPGIVCIRAGSDHNFPRHGHNCERFEIVISGSFTDGTGRVYRTGDVMIAHHMDMYGPHIAGPDGYIVVEYFGSVLGTYEMFWDTQRGPKKANKIEEDFLAKLRAGDTPSAGTEPDLPVSGQPQPASPDVERGAAVSSIHDDDFWNHVPAPYLQPLVDACLPFDGMGYRLFALGDPNDPETPAVVLFRAPPGYKLARHSHDCHRLEVIIAGSLTDEHGVEHAAGAVMTAEPDEMYGPSVAGPNGWISAEFFSRLAGTYEITWDSKDGPLFDNRLQAAGA